MAAKKKTYWEKFKDPRWQKKRLEVMNRAGFVCVRCGDSENTLNVHHRWYISGMEPWDYGTDQLECLCDMCHQMAVTYRKQVAELLSRIDSAFLDELRGILVGRYWLRWGVGDSPLPLDSDEFAEGIAYTSGFPVDGDDILKAFGAGNTITREDYLAWRDKRKRAMRKPTTQEG